MNEEKQQTVLIAGGTGLLGRHLSEMLKDEGFRVIHLSRHQNLQARFPAYRWDLDAGHIDEEALERARRLWSPPR